MKIDKTTKYLILGLGLTLSAPVGAQQNGNGTVIQTEGGDKIYRYVGPDGEVMYSDQPPAEGAEAVEVPKAPTYEFQEPARFEAYEEAEPRDGEQSYRTVRVTYPQEDQVIWDNTGTMRVSVAVEPDLKQGHQLQLLFNGEVRYTGSSTTVSLSEVWRNTYDIVPQVINNQGETVARGEGVTFHMKQQSANF